MFEIRPLRAEDKDVWLDLWQGYVTFYQADVSTDVTAVTWARLLDEMEPNMFGLVAVDGNDKPMGFVHCVLHLNTWTDRDVCYLEDLFVNPRARGGGIGRTLITSVVDRCKDNGWGKVYWLTKQDNAQARLLYEKLTPPSGFIQYVITP